MTATGPIAWRARGELPATWEALAGASTYGDYSLQIRVDLIKYSLFATVCAQTVEESVYSPVQLLLAGKMVALEIIPSGVDFWSDQAIGFSSSARASSENVSYPDRIKALWDRHARLLLEVASLKQLAGSTIAVTKRTKVPTTSTTGALRTPDPNSFPQLVTTFRGVASTISMP